MKNAIRYPVYQSIALLLIMYCQRLPCQNGSLQADSILLKNHVAAISADSMQGRRAGTQDERRAAAYIEAYFQKINLQPAGEEGTFKQQVPLPRGFIFSHSTIVVLGETLFYPTDFYTFRVPAKQSVFNKGLIFAGYGIHTDDRQFDSYYGVDVKNKIVVALNSRLWDRNRLPKDFQVDQESQARWAKEHGAAGLLLLGDSHRQKMEHQKKGKETAVAELFDPIDKDGFLWIHIADGRSFAKKLFQIENLLSVSPIEHASSGASLQNNIDCKQMISANVVGEIEGTDLKGEYITITAHYDHLGVGTKVAGDSIYNGALDNASGTAVLLEIARLISSSPEKPHRSILFIATGAEELGFYGAKHFVEHPTVPKEAIVANINIDVAGFSYGSKECWMTLLGAEYNDMGEKFEDVAEELGIHIMPNVIPSYYKRSDGYIFAMAGIPAISPASGMPLEAFNNGMEHFLKFYHKPNDEFAKSPIDFQVLSLQTQAITNMIRKVADDSSRPHWTSEIDSDSWIAVREFFGQIRVFFSRLF